MRKTEFCHHITRAFICPACQNKTAHPDYASLMGEKKMDLSHFERFDMILITCKTCGYIQFYDRYFLPEHFKSETRP